MSPSPETPTDQLIAFVRESNKIEGIVRAPSVAEIAAHQRFLALPTVTIGGLKQFVAVVQPGAALREGLGMDVRVGAHVAPPGGAGIVADLGALLLAVEQRTVRPWAAHVTYEMLHPFMDGNGRSGRVLWLWMMGGHARLGFLHTFYYQTLDGVR